MAITLQLDRGTAGIIDLNDGTNYALLDGWQPRVAKRQRSQLAGRWPYENVIEQIPIRVFSKQSDPATAKAEVLQKLDDLAAALDQAYTWYNGAQVDPVILKYQPEGSALANPLQSVVLGAPDSARDMLSLPVTFNRDMQAWEINPLVLEIERRGLWLGDAETPAASASVGNPGVMTVNFSSNVVLPSPTKVVLTSSTSVAVGSGYIVLADNNDKILLVEAENGTGSSISVITDSSASGGSYLRYTASTSGNITFANIGANLNSSARRFAVLMKARSATANYDYLVSAEIQTNSGANSSSTRKIAIDNASGTRTWYVGLAALPERIDDLRLSIEPVGSSSVGNGLEIDYIIIVALDETTSIIEFLLPGIQVFDDPTIDPRELSRPNPAFTATYAATNTVYMPHAGNTFVLNNGTEMAALITGSSFSTNWTLTDSNGTNISFSLTATRRTGYLTPR